MAGRGTDIKLRATRESHATAGRAARDRHRAAHRPAHRQPAPRPRRPAGRPGLVAASTSRCEDDLMKMFAGEWTIKVLGWLGMEEGMAIEDKRITKGILRAQKKVEERNFLARKNLLEYDEVMDHQRTTFYGMRQQVLEGREVDQVIWGMIGDAINDAVDKYITQDYVAADDRRVGARPTSRSASTPTTSRGMRGIEDLEEYIKDQARAEAETNISADARRVHGRGRRTTPSDWDTKGLSSLGDEPVPREPVAEPDPQDGRRTSWRTGCARPRSSRSTSATSPGWRSTSSRSTPRRSWRTGRRRSSRSRSSPRR